MMSYGRGDPPIKIIYISALCLDKTPRGLIYFKVYSYFLWESILF